MHAVAFAEFPYFAVGAFIFSHPFTITIWFEFVFPNIPEIVFVDIALMEIATDAGARRYATVAKHRCNRQSCLASVVMVAYSAFVFAEETFASVRCVDFFCFAHAHNEIHQAAELFVSDLQFGVFATPRRENSEKAPAF